MKNKYLIFITLMIMALMAASVSSSYAILKGNSVSNKNQTITTGSVKLNINENFENIDKGLGVLNDVTAIMGEEYYEFSVSNTGDADVNYKLYLLNEAPEDYKGKIIPNEYIRVGLEVNNKEIGPISLSLSKNIIDNNKLNANEIVHYKLRVWFDEKKKNELRTMTDYKSFLKLKVEAEQDI